MGKKYWNSFYNCILLLIPGFCIPAGIFWTVCKLLGSNPEVSWLEIGLFDFSQLIYLAIALYLIYQNHLDSSYYANHLKYLKFYASVVLLIQYNFTLHLFASTYVWECSFLFFLLTVLFFDSKMMAWNMLSYGISLALATLRNPDDFLPLHQADFGEIVAFRIVLFLLIFLCITMIVYFAERFLTQAQINSEENVQLLHKQLESYQDSDWLDMELRKFRHDIRNHFICMDHLLKNNNVEDLQVYFQDLTQSFAFQEKAYFCGNHVIDAILNHDLSRHCSDHVNVTVYGSLSDDISISSMDLCTLFSNILSNAITSVNQCDSSEEPELTIHFQLGTQYFFIGVTNSVCEENLLELEQKRKKSFNRNHGFGLNKIKEIVEEYHGSFKQTLQEKTIMTEVYLPL